RRRSAGRPASRPAARRAPNGGPSEGGAPRRRPAAPRPMMDPATPSVEPEAAKPARALLEEILGKMGLDDVEIVYIARSEGEYFEVRGPRLAALIGREGKTLEALNLIYNNIINVGARNNRHYYTIDAEGYRARRADQLKTLALATLERVVREQRPIKLEPMLPSERKIVHLALADSPFVRTESEGVEPERRLVVFPKDAPPAD
ncbi:MAG: R3H domain-containing nucleic acid-binding protein, partial [Vulcanimicrobiaceae bacterium]